MPEIVIQIIQVCVIPLLGILTKYLVDYLTAKRNEINSKTDNETAQKYANMIYQTVVDCVIATNQTYVDSLKKSGSFDEAAQKEAFNRTMNAIMTILSDDAKEYIAEATGDLNTYLTQLIEAEVNKRK
nr:MAG TPA: holin [Caudoviricetes sp.]